MQEKSVNTILNISNEVLVHYSKGDAPIQLDKCVAWQRVCHGYVDVRLLAKE